MRILIVSDIHANPWALHAVAREAGAVDHILCAGDTVNYGPDPQAVVTWLRDHAVITVRGNHDHAVALDVDPKASPAKQAVALAMRDWTRSQLAPSDLTWLARLPLTADWEIGGCRFALVHGTPLDPLYDYRLSPRSAEALLDELTTGLRTDVLVLGHTHLPLLRRWRGIQIVNPGSVGQPLDGDARAAYAVWEDGVLSLRRSAYDQTDLIDQLGRVPLASPLGAELIHMLRRASSSA